MGRTVTWAYGVTTVPERRDTLLPRTLASLRAAGFDRPRLFVDGWDGHDNRYADLMLETTAHYPKVYTVLNWLLALWELYGREPDRDRYAVFQDDFVTYRNLRAYLDRCDYNLRGYWNLYTFPSNQIMFEHDGYVGWREASLLGGDGHGQKLQHGRGAVALVFNRETVVTLLSQRCLVEKPMNADTGRKKIDGCVVTALNLAGWREYVHNPSLVQHTGDVSSMGNLPHLKATSFRGEDFDALTLLAGRGRTP